MYADKHFDTGNSKHCKLLTPPCGYCVRCLASEVSGLLSLIHQV